MLCPLNTIPRNGISSMNGICIFGTDKLGKVEEFPFSPVSTKRRKMVPAEHKRLIAKPAMNRSDFILRWKKASTQAIAIPATIPLYSLYVLKKDVSRSQRIMKFAMFVAIFAFLLGTI